MLTLFTVPKAFEGDSAVLQCRALENWLACFPAENIILFGDEKGVAAAAARYGVRHASCPVNEFGTPVLNTIFQTASEMANTPYLAFINADILLDPAALFWSWALDFWQRLPDGFLLVARRWNLDVPEEVHVFSLLQQMALQKNDKYPPVGMDFFVFPKLFFDGMPPFSIGWPGAKYDNWMVWYTRSHGFPVYDITDAVMLIHQNHPAFGGKSSARYLEHWRNLRLVGGYGYCYDICDATHAVVADMTLKRPLSQSLWVVVRRYVQRARDFIRFELLLLLFVLSSAVVAQEGFLSQFYRGDYASVASVLQSSKVASENRLLLSNVYFQLGRYDAARSLLKSQAYDSLHLQPFERLLHVQILAASGDIEGAKKHYEEIQRTRGYSDFLSLYAAIAVAKALFAEQRYSEGQYFLRAVLKNTDNKAILYQVHTLLFDHALMVMDQDAAITALRTLHVLDVRLRTEAEQVRRFRLRFGENFPLVFPDDRARIARAELLLVAGHYSHVVALLGPHIRRGVTDKQRHILMQYLWSQAQYLSGQYRLALTGFQNVIFWRDMPQDMYWSAHIRAVECLLRLQDYTDAFRYIRLLQSAPLPYRVAGEALYLSYLVAIRYPPRDLLRVSEKIQKEFPYAPEVAESALEVWYYALDSGYRPLPVLPFSSHVSRFLARWRPLHGAIAPGEHVLSQVPLGYTALALLESAEKPGSALSEDLISAVRAGFGSVILGSFSSVRATDLDRAKVLMLMGRPYESISWLRQRLFVAPKNTTVWQSLDNNWIVLLFPFAYATDVRRSAEQFKLDPALLFAVIRAESTFNSETKSPAGAAGLMQLMPTTAKQMAQKLGLQYTDALLTTPATNIQLGSGYLAAQLKRFNGDLILALAAYNAGPTAVQRWIILNPDLKTATGREKIALIPYAETRRYVGNILDSYAIYSYLAEVTSH